MAAARGVTLVEVLATLVLVGIVLPASMMGVTLSLRAAHLARHQQEASLLAESRLNEILALGDATTMTGVGDFSPDRPDYRWETSTAVSDFGLTEVIVTVSWLERGRDRSVSLSTLLYTSTGTTGTEASGTGTTP